MADAQVLYAEKATDTSANSTTWVDCATIAAASFTASKKYAILAFAYLKAAGASALPRVRLVHGTTPTEFTDALVVSEHGGASARVCYGWFHVFDQPSTTELVKIQVSDSGVDTAIVELAQIMALKLSDDFTENTDWYYNEVTTDDAYATTTQDGASITVSANGSDRWLVIGNTSTDIGNASQTYENRLTIAGTDERRAFTIDGEDTAAFHNWLLMRSTVLPSGSPVCKIGYQASGTANTLLSSRVFALNLSRFAQLAQDEDVADDVPPQPSFSSGDPCQVAITPAATGDFVILATTILECNTASNQQDHRLQVNNGGGLASDPNYGDDIPNVSYGNNAAEEYPVSLMKVRSLSSGASRTINYDWQRRANNTTVIDVPELIVFSVALAAAGDQDLTGTTFTKAPTFPAGAVTSTYDLTGTTFTKAPTFPQGAITASNTLVGTTFTKAPTFPQGAVSPGPVDLAGTTFTKAPTFPQGAIGTVGADQDLMGATFTKAPTFPQGAVTATRDLAGTTFQKAPTFPTGAVTATRDLSGVTFTRAPTFPQGAVTSVANLAGLTFQRAPTFGAGTLAQEGGPQPLGGVTFTKAPTFPTGAITSIRDLAGTTFTRAPTFPTGQMGWGLVGTTFTKSPTFPLGTIAADAVNIGGVTFVRAGVFPTGIISTGILGEPVVGPAASLVGQGNGATIGSGANRSEMAGANEAGG